MEETTTFSNSLLQNVDVLVQIFRFLPIRTRFLLRKTCSDFVFAVDKLWKAEKYMKLETLLTEHRIYMNEIRGRTSLYGAFLQRDSPEFELALKFLESYSPNLREIEFSDRERFFFEKTKASAIPLLGSELSTTESFPKLSGITFYGVSKIPLDAFANFFSIFGPSLTKIHLDRLTLQPDSTNSNVQVLFQKMTKLQSFETWRSPAISRSFLENFSHPETLVELKFDSANLHRAAQFLQKCVNVKSLEFSARTPEKQSEILRTIFGMPSLECVLLEGFIEFALDGSILENSNIREFTLIPGFDLEVLKLKAPQHANVYSRVAETFLRAFADFNPKLRKLYILDKYPIRNCEILEVLRKFNQVEDLKLQIAVSSHDSEFLDEWLDPLPLQFLWFEVYQFGAGAILPRNLHNFLDLEQLTLELDHDDPRFSIIV